MNTEWELFCGAYCINHRYMVIFNQYSTFDVGHWNFVVDNNLAGPQSQVL